MKSIVVLSGKGGVGKSSVSASLAVALSKEKKVVCADCDVDASNLSLLFSLSSEEYAEWKPLSVSQMAVIDESKCIGCGKCVNTCYFNAMEFKGKVPHVNEFSCEGCGACELVCPVGAITLKDIDNANIGYVKTKYGFPIASAQLIPGSAASGRVVSEVRKKANEVANGAEYMIIDSAAGIGCPVIASITGNDYAIIVTEPTPSGFADMKRALEVVNHFRIKCGIIINKFDLNPVYTAKIELFAKNNGLKIIKKIPFDTTFVKAMVNMIPIIDFDKKYERVFEEIKETVFEELTA